ncbi:MAG: hypothetical protein QOE15_192, partial [Acidimicrobiaceae bacterium]|nr:hypothetical protein [Acidimicrobiaceae bacterium]
MTKDLDEIHHATLPAMHDAVAEWTEMQHELRADPEAAEALEAAEAIRAASGVRRGASRRG